MPGNAVASKVCSYWRTKANKVLQRHVAAFKQQDGIVLHVKSFASPNERYPHYFIDSVLREQLAAAYDNSKWGGEPDVLPDLLRECPLYVRELFDNVQIVDFEESNDERYTINPVNDLVDSLRFFGQHVTTGRYDAREMVGFDYHFEAARETQVLFLKHPVPRMLTMDARQVVINLNCGPPALSPICGSFGEGHCTGLGEPPLTMEPKEPESLVLILEHDWPHSPLDSDAALDYPGEVKDYAEWFSRYLDYWFCPTDSLSLIIVGLEGFLKPKEDLEAFIAEFKLHLPSDERVEFLSRKQYGRRVGAETYRLHTKW